MRKVELLSATVLGLGVTRSDDAKVIAPLQTALKDESVSVRLVAVEGIFNLNQYKEGLPVLMKVFTYSIIHAQVRAACILDTQSPKAYKYIKPAVENMLLPYNSKESVWDGNKGYLPAIEILKQRAEETDFKKISGIPCGWNYPFKKALKTIYGEANYYPCGNCYGNSKVTRATLVYLLRIYSY